MDAARLPRIPRVRAAADARQAGHIAAIVMCSRIIGWAKALARPRPLGNRLCAVLTRHKSLVQQTRGHGAREVHNAERLCQRLCPPNNDRRINALRTTPAYARAR